MIDEPRWLLLSVWALAGLLIGSFLNVCIYRLPRDLSVVIPRSFCPGCGTSISWQRNVPVISFALLRGRCSSCRNPIGWRYPLVELMTAVLFVLVFLHYGVSLATLKWTLFDCALTVLFWTDLEARLLIDEVTLGGLAAGLLLAFLVPMPVFFGLWLPQLSPVWSSCAESALTALCLSGLLLLARTAFRLLRGKEGLGLGDVKLVAMLGAFVGLQGAVWILMTATLGGTILGLLFILLTRKDFAAYELPFGSFLCFAAAAWSLWR